MKKGAATASIPLLATILAAALFPCLAADAYVATAQGSVSISATVTDPNSFSIPQATSPNGGGGASYFPNLPPSPSSNPNDLYVYNVPLVLLPAQSGTLTEDSSAGKIMVRIPASDVPGQTSFTITSDPLIQVNDYLIQGGRKLIDGVFYNIFAQDQDGNYIHSFPKPLTIVLPIVPAFANAKNLSVYWLNEADQDWVPVSGVTFANSSASFQVSHLTKFGIFETLSGNNAADEGAIAQAAPIDFPETAVNQNPVPAPDAALFDLVSEPTRAKITAGSSLPVSVKLSNFGGAKRLDVSIIYSVSSDAGEVIYSSSETVAVETTASFIKNIPIPSDTAPGMYHTKVSITYGGQLMPAVSESSFSVTAKPQPITQKDIALYASIALLLGALIAVIVTALFRRHFSARFSGFDYPEIPSGKRVFYELLSDIVAEMRMRVGDDALAIAQRTEGLKIDRRTGRVLDLTEKPSRVVASLVAEYEKALGKKVSFSFRLGQPGKDL